MSDFLEQLDLLYSEGRQNEIESAILTFLARVEANDPFRITLLSELGNYYKGVSRLKEAEDIYTEVIHLIHKNLTSALDAYPIAVNNLAGIYRLRRELQKAIRLFETAEQYLLDHDMDHSYAYASIMNNRALVFIDSGELDKALNDLTSALAIVRELGGSADEIATSLLNLASLHYKKESFVQAEALLTESISHFTALEQPSTHMASAYHLKALLYIRQQRYQDAQFYLRKSLALTEKFFGKNIEYASTLKTLAHLYEQTGDLEQVQAYRIESDKIIANLSSARNE